MAEPWLLLERAGVPLGALRAAGRGFDDGAIRSAVSRVIEAELAQPEREALLAWLRGFRHHWADRFARVFGSEGDRWIAALEAAPFDPDRYLKLRRIAIENLANLI